MNAKSSINEGLIQTLDLAGRFTGNKISFKSFLTKVFANKAIKNKINDHVKTKNVQELKEFWKAQNFISQ